MNSAFTYSEKEQKEIQTRLNMQLGPEYLSLRSGPANTQIHYLTGNKAIELANKIFGFNGYSTQIISLTQDSDEQGKYTYSCILRIILKDGTFREDVGIGIGSGRNKSESIEKGKKEAVTDAFKRCLRLFGSSVGNCLYDKEYLRMVGKVKKESVGMGELLRESTVFKGKEEEEVYLHDDDELIVDLDCEIDNQVANTGNNNLQRANSFNQGIIVKEDNSNNNFRPPQVPGNGTTNAVKVQSAPVSTNMPNNNGNSTSVAPIAYKNGNNAPTGNFNQSATSHDYRPPAMIRQESMPNMNPAGYNNQYRPQNHNFQQINNAAPPNQYQPILKNEYQNCPPLPPKPQAETMPIRPLVKSVTVSEGSYAPQVRANEKENAQNQVNNYPASRNTFRPPMKNKSPESGLNETGTNHNNIQRTDSKPITGPVRSTLNAGLSYTPYPYVKK